MASVAIWAGVAIWAVVPFKGFDDAKQRLSGEFSPAFRRALAGAMLLDVLAALGASRRLAGIVLVTADAGAAGIGRAHGCRLCGAQARHGHTAAVVAGGLALEAGCGMLSLPADVPGVTAEEIDMLLDAHGAAPAFTNAHGAAPAFTIAPAADRRGSNAIVATPPGAVPLAYGDDSFAPHLAAARRRGIVPRVVELAGIGRDVDTPADLRAAWVEGRGIRTQDFLRKSAEFRAVPR